MYVDPIPRLVEGRDDLTRLVVQDPGESGEVWVGERHDANHAPRTFPELRRLPDVATMALPELAPDRIEVASTPLGLDLVEGFEVLGADHLIGSVFDQLEEKAFPGVPPITALAAQLSLLSGSMKTPLSARE